MMGKLIPHPALRGDCLTDRLKKKVVIFRETGECGRVDCSPLGVGASDRPVYLVTGRGIGMHEVNEGDRPQVIN